LIEADIAGCFKPGGDEVVPSPTPTPEPLAEEEPGSGGRQLAIGSGTTIAHANATFVGEGDERPICSYYEWIKYVVGNLVGVGLTSIQPVSGNPPAELFDLLIATWSLTLTGTVIGIIGGLTAVSDLAAIGEEIPLVHKHLKRKVKRKVKRPAGSSAGDSEVELELEVDASLAGDSTEPSELEVRVVSMESKLDALTASTSKLADSMDELRADMRRLLMLQQLSDVMDRGGPMPLDFPGAPPLPPPPTTQPPPETIARRRKGTSQMGLSSKPLSPKAKPLDEPEAASIRRSRVKKSGDEPGQMPGAMPGKPTFPLPSSSV